MHRPCPACRHDDWHPITHCILTYGYCAGCGMVYVRERPEDAEADYVQESRYARGQAIGSGETPYERERHQETARLLAPWLEPGLTLPASVLDIGCARGGLLTALADLPSKPFVAGCDPAQACVDAVRAKGLRAWQDSLPLRSKLCTSFRLVVLSHVVEHLWEPAAALHSVVPYAEYFYLEVPNASAMGRQPIFEPYWEFSTEHINLFGMTQLTWLADSVGLTLVASGERDIRLGPKHSTPTVWGVFARRGALPEAIVRYMDRSHWLARDMNLRLHHELAGHQKVIVWGAGAFWQKMREWDAWQGKEVVVVDRAAAGARSPDIIAQMPPEVPIVVASTLQAAAIKADIAARGLANPVIEVSD